MAGQQDNGADRTEKPTAKRLQEAAKNGDILQSRELAAALVVMVGAGWLAVAGPMLLDALRTMLVEGLRFGHQDVASFNPAERGVTLLKNVALPLAGLFGATLIAAIAAPAMLGSLGFRTGAFAPKASKLNPMNGIKRIFGIQGLIELGKSVAKVVLLGAIGIWMVWDRLAQITQMGGRGLEGALGEVGEIFIFACMMMAGGMALIAMIDVPGQIFQRGKRLAMTKQEIKDEHKEAEGSPELKGHIRRKQFEVMSNSVRKAVKEANVVIVNPTHFAVALRYRAGFDAAPVVVARGRDAIAQGIRDLAGEAQVPVLRYPELARAVYFTSRVGQPVNEDLYMAVATVLAFLFRVDKAMSSMADAPPIEVPAALRFDMDGKQVR